VNGARTGEQLEQAGHGAVWRLCGEALGERRQRAARRPCGAGQVRCQGCQREAQRGAHAGGPAREAQQRAHERVAQRSRGVCVAQGQA
jgi:hypothetical protein